MAEAAATIPGAPMDENAPASSSAWISDAPGAASSTAPTQRSFGDVESAGGHSSAAGNVSGRGRNDAPPPVAASSSDLRPLKSNRMHRLRVWTWNVVEDPQSSRLAFAVSVILLALIIISCTSFMIQTLNYFYAGDQTVWNVIETVCIIAFTAEYILRLFGSPDRCRFVMGALNIVDLIAIVPFYVELGLKNIGGGVAGLAVFRVIRLARVFRLFKLGRYSDGLKTFANTMTKSTRPLAMLVFFMAIAIVLFSSAIHYCERGTWDEVNRKWWIDVEGETFQMVTQCSGTVNMTLSTDSHADETLSKSWSVEYPSEVIAAGGEVITASLSGSATATAMVTNTSGSLANMTLQWHHDVTMLPAIDSTSPQAVQTSASKIIEESVRQELLAGAVQYRAQLPASSVLGVAVSSSISLACTEMGCIACPESLASRFESIPASFYWASVTMTTVGYGDVYPLTTAGQLVASITMMFGILILALPITVIGSNFATEYEEYLRRQKIDAEYRQRLKFEAIRSSQLGDLSGKGDGAAAGDAAKGASVDAMASGNFREAGAEPLGELGGDAAVYAYIEDVLHSRVGHPLSVFQEMDWVAHRARNELRAAIQLMVRQQRDLLVLKLHGIVRRYERERKREQVEERSAQKLDP